MQVITSLAGGAGMNAYHLARELDREAFESRLVFGGSYPLDQRVQSEGIAHDRVDWKRSADPLATARGARQMRDLVRRHRPHIVHAHCSLAGVAARLVGALSGVPRIVFTVHAFASRDHQPFWRKRMFLELERAMDRFTHHYCVTTQTFRDQLVARRIATPDKVSVIPLGIEVPPPPSSEARKIARAKLGLEHGELSIGIVGRLEKQKGIVHALRAFPRVHGAIPRARLLILGSGPLEPALRAEAQRLRCAHAIDFLGWRDDVPSLLPGLDVLCLPSLWESFSYVVLEAMAARVPVVASGTDALPEVLRAGRCGVLVPPADESRLAQALIELLRNDLWRRSLRAVGRQHLERGFDLDTMIRSYEQLYRRLLGPGLENRQRLRGVA